MAKANLNSYIEFFRLTYDGTTTDISEPLQWANTEIALMRNTQYYGFDLEVIGEDATLEFNYVDNPEVCDLYPGGNIIIDQYALHGQDANILFQFGYFDETDTEVIVYEATLDLNIYELNKKTVKAGARRVSFDDLIRTRFETPIDIASGSDLDGNAITPITLEEVELHSKGIFKQSQRTFPDTYTLGASDCRNPVSFPNWIKNSGILQLRYESNSISAGLNTVFRSKTFYAQPAFANVVIEDFAENQNIPDGVGDSGVNPQWILKESGELTLDLGISWDASMAVSSQWRGARADLKVSGCTRGDARMGYSRIRLRLRIGATTYDLLDIDDNNGGCLLAYHGTGYYYIYCGSPTDSEVINPHEDLPRNVSGTIFDNSGSDGYNTVSSAVQNNPTWTTFSVTQNVSVDDEVALWVEIYGEGNYDEDLVQASDLGWIGSAVFWETDKPIADGGTGNASFWNMTIKSDSPASTADSALIFETGEAIVSHITGDNNRLRSEILGRTDTTPAYPGDGCASLNVITNGYQIRKFSTSSRPIITNMAEYISSIQAIYNLGFGLENDGGDDVIRIEEVEYFFNEEEMLSLSSVFDYVERTAIELIPNEIEIGYETFIDEGINLLDEFNTKHKYLTPIKKNKSALEIISSYVAGGYTIEVQRREQFSSSPSDSLENDEDNFIINVLRDGGGFKSLQDEGFTSVTGVFSPSSSYNLKISPKRMLYRWAKWLKGAFKYKDQGADEVRFTFASQNNDLVTEITDACEQGGTVTESGNVILQDFPDAGAGIFSPEWVEFRSTLRWDDFETLKNKLRGSGGGTDNYGYITVLTPNGTTKKVWPYEVRYNISRQELTVKALNSNL